MTRTNIILAALAAIQLVVLLVVNLTGGDDAKENAGDDRAGEKPYQVLAFDQIGRIRITDVDGKTLTVTRGDEETPWVLASFGDYPAQEADVQKIRDGLGSLTFGRIVTRKPGNFVKLNVADTRFSRRLEVFDRSDKPVADLYIGEGKKSGSLVVREAGRDVAYHATGLSTFDLNTDESSWVETRFTDWEESGVARVRLTNESGTFEVARTEPAKKDDEEPKDEKEPKDDEPAEVAKPKWRVTVPEGSTVALDDGKVDGFVGGFGRIYLGSPVGAMTAEAASEYGLDVPAATAVVTMKDGTVHTLRLGKPVDDGEDRYLTRSGFDYVVTLRGYAVKNQFLEKLEDLAKTPEPEGDAPK